MVAWLGDPLSSQLELGQWSCYIATTLPGGRQLIRGEQIAQEDGLTNTGAVHWSLWFYKYNTIRRVMSSLADIRRQYYM